MATVQAIIQLTLVLLFLSACSRDFQRFKKTQDCTRQPGCALDTPQEIYKNIRSKLKCAIKCTLVNACVNFNYWNSNSSCHLFYSFPYKLLSTYSCSNYDMIPRYPNVYQVDQNLALHQRTCQSTTYEDKMSWNAVDGDCPLIASFCSHTNEGDNGNNWFMVDLFEMVVVSYVRILARDGNPSITIRYSNLTFGITNTSSVEKTPVMKAYPVCGLYLGPGVSAQWIQVNCTSGIPAARYVIVHQGHVYSMYGGYLCICEIEVFGII